jgi:hypothetical protein
MKVLIAYDGSPCAEAALDDLTHAGFPNEGKAKVVSVAEVWLPPPPPSAYEVVEMATTVRSPAALERKYMGASKVVAVADQLAARAARLVEKNFPGWKVSHEASWGSPTWQLFT